MTYGLLAALSGLVAASLGAVIGAEALVGNGATVLDGAVVGRRSLVAAGSTVPPRMSIGDGMLAAGVPARIIGEVAAGAKQWVETNPGLCRERARRHAAGVRPVPEPRTGDESRRVAHRGFDGLPSPGRCPPSAGAVSLRVGRNGRGDGAYGQGPG